MRRTALLLPLLSALAPLAHLAAQDTLPLTPGARVRVSAPDLIGRRAVTASVVALRRDTLVLRPVDSGAATWAVPLGRLERLEVSRGRRSRATGAVIGFFAGALAGAVYGAAGHPGLAHTDIPEEGEAAIYAGVAGLLGAGVGAALGGERWARVRLPGRLNVAPHWRGGFALSARLAF
jgi:hypothetical protein